LVLAAEKDPAMRRAAKQKVKRARRRFYESRGDDRYSRPSLHSIEDRLAEVLDLPRPGYFIEAGAADGFEQSNTYWLERFHGWEGVLIEPVQDLAARCRRTRQATVVEAALVASEDAGSTVPVRFAGLMSLVEGARGSDDADAAHVAAGLEVQRLAATYRVEAAARTLTDVLDEVGAPAEVSFMSLDVEALGDC
jgi:hypothetical protein